MPFHLPINEGNQEYNLRIISIITNNTLIIRKIRKNIKFCFPFKKILYFCNAILRGRAVVARRAHNPEVAGSSPAPATQNSRIYCQQRISGIFFIVNAY